VAIDAAQHILDEHRDRTVVGTITRRDRTGAYHSIDVDGTLFRREHDQDEARRHQRYSAIWDRICDEYGVPSELLSELDNLSAANWLEEIEQKLRMIGHMLVFNGPRPANEHGDRASCAAPSTSRETC
jgi:hypothetical protein